MTPDQESLTDSDINRAVVRIAHEILERNRGADNLVLLGIPGARVPGQAHRRSQPCPVSRAARCRPARWTWECTATTCDCGPRVALHPTVIPGGDITGKTVVLVDDVLFSGRTTRGDGCPVRRRAAKGRATGRSGRPRTPRSAHPRADYVGKTPPTSRDDDVQVT